MLIDEILTLRNAVHKGTLRFDLTPSLWKSDYLLGKAPEMDTVLVVRSGGVLKGYAVCSFQSNHEVKACKVLEICADGEATLSELIDKIIEKGKKEDVDFILLRRCDEPFDEVFKRKGFLSFLQNAIVVALFNPKEILSSISEKIEHGKIIKLAIQGYDPVLLRVGEKRVMVVSKNKPDLTVTTDRRTFLNLLFGKTSFFRQLVQGRVSVNSLLNVSTAAHFFSLIKQKKWYIPSGDFH